jgi:predicted  nucleic acid-binding Zn-ribbon protein
MADPKWLKDLQGNVQGAVKELAKLRTQNKSLKTQLDNTKAKLADAEKSTGRAKPAPAAEAWKTERKEVRRRVARLTKQLEELI